MTLNFNPFNPLLVARALLATILLLLVLCAVSCSPERRLHTLLKSHPALLHKDTVLTEVIKFIPDTNKVIAYTDTITDKIDQGIIKDLLNQLDSCGSEDKKKILQYIPRISKPIIKDAFVKDCPDIIEKDSLHYVSPEGHIVNLYPNKKGGYDLDLIVNCPLPTLEPHHKNNWLTWFLAGLAIGVILVIVVLVFK
jgi:hypothetical protein